MSGAGWCDTNPGCGMYCGEDICHLRCGAIKINIIKVL